jgi:methylmalonyl-CoA mutase cobalamin-binding subunit
MTTKVNGPRQVYFQRLVRALRKEGVKKMEYHSGGVTIVIPLDDTYLEKMARGHPPAPDAEEADRERRKFTLKDW